MAERRIRAVAATPIPDELVQRIMQREPRVELVVEQDLLPPMRHGGDHGGDPDWTRPEGDEQRFRDLVDSAEVLYGLPDEDPKALKRTVEANPDLRWVQTMPAGGGAQVKGAGLTEEQLQRIAFTTSAGAHEVPLAEFSIFGLLAGFKTLPKLQAYRAAQVGAVPRWEMGLLSGSKVLIIGLGHIGRATAVRLDALGVHVAGTSRRDVAEPGVTEVIHPDDLASRIGEFDGIVVTLPGTEQTEGLVSAEVLAAVKPGAVVVNVGRGTVIDEQALIAALRDERVGFAALDVVAHEPLAADSPLWTLPNVLLTPHTAALNSAEDGLIADLFAENATRFLDGRDLINRVNTVEFY